MIDIIISACKNNVVNEGIYVSLCIVNNEKTRLEILSEEEKGLYEEFNTKQRKSDFVVGRIAAKNAIINVNKDLDAQKIDIKNGIMGEPVITDYDVTISHDRESAFAAASNKPMFLGVDVQTIDCRKAKKIGTIVKDDCIVEDIGPMSRFSTN